MGKHIDLFLAGMTVPLLTAMLCCLLHFSHTHWTSSQHFMWYALSGQDECTGSIFNHNIQLVPSRIACLVIDSKKLREEFWVAFCG